MVACVIEAAPSRKLDSTLVTYYVRDAKTQKVLVKYTSEIKHPESIENWETLTAEQQLEVYDHIAIVQQFINMLRELLDLLSGQPPVL